jgi:hypothetical protein
LQPLSPLGHPWYPIHPCHPYCPRGEAATEHYDARPGSRATGQGRTTVGERNSGCFAQMGSLFIKRAQPNMSPVHRGRGCRLMPHAAIPHALVQTPRQTRLLCRQAGLPAQTPLVYSPIFYAMPAVGLGLLGGRCQSVPRTATDAVAAAENKAHGKIEAQYGSAGCWRIVVFRGGLAPWAVGMARVDRVARGGQGVIGAAIYFPPRKGLLFTRPSPASSAATISKMPLKPAAPPRLRAPVSPFRNNKNADRV